MTIWLGFTNLNADSTCQNEDLSQRKVVIWEHMGLQPWRYPKMDGLPKKIKWMDDKSLGSPIPGTPWNLQDLGGTVPAVQLCSLAQVRLPQSERGQMHLLGAQQGAPWSEIRGCLNIFEIQDLEGRLEDIWAYTWEQKADFFGTSVDLWEI